MDKCFFTISPQILEVGTICLKGPSVNFGIFQTNTVRKGEGSDLCSYDVHRKKISMFC